MFEKRIQVGEEKHLTLDEMAGSVSISGWGEPEALVRLASDNAEQLLVREGEDGPVISAQASCEFLVPANLPVTIRQVAGSLVVKGLNAPLNAEQIRGNMAMSESKEAVLAEVYGNLKVSELPSLRVVGTLYGDALVRGTESVELQNIRGNLRIKGAGHLRVSRIGGNLKASKIEGNIDAEQVGGNALLDGVGGRASLDRVAGNLVIRNMPGGVKATRIGGNLLLDGPLGRGRTYQFKADGNATLRLTEETSAYLSLTANGKVSAPETLVDRKLEGNTLTGTLGDGGAEVVVEAKGNVMVSGAGPSFGAELGEEISRQVEASLQAIDLEAIGQQVSEEMEAALSRLRVKLETVDWERMGNQARRTVEMAMERMQKDMNHLAEKAAHHQARVEHRAEREIRRQERNARKDRSVQFSLETETAGAAAPANEETDYQAGPIPDIEEERLIILRMVEQGQITPEDAELLLDALM